jgi:hypothetical protein
MKNRCLKQIKNGRKEFELAHQLVKEEIKLEDNFS